MDEDLARPVIMVGLRDQPIQFEISPSTTCCCVPLGDDEDEQDSGVDRLAKRRSSARSAPSRGATSRSSSAGRTTLSSGSRTTTSHRSSARAAAASPTSRTASASTSTCGPTRKSPGRRAAPRPTPAASRAKSSSRKSPRGTSRPARRHAGDTVELQADGEYLFTATVSRGGEIQVSRGSGIAEELDRAFDREHDYRRPSEGTASKSVVRLSPADSPELVVNAAIFRWNTTI